ENIFNALGRQRAQTGAVIRRFDDDFMRANAIHAVEHALGLAVEIALDTESRKLVWHHPYRPTRRIALRRRAAIGIGAVSLNFRRRLGFVPIAERAESAFDFDCLTGEVRGAFCTICRNDYPAADNGVFSELRQLRFSPMA